MIQGGHYFDDALFVETVDLSCESRIFVVNWCALCVCKVWFQDEGFLSTAFILLILPFGENIDPQDEQFVICMLFQISIFVHCVECDYMVESRLRHKDVVK
ncbi:MAG: hypothetical protein JW384_02841 [Nitrosomonadaceae bacterium]|nr:hypothetical protein [Nitrosomonadaceae bacterium]